MRCRMYHTVRVLTAHDNLTPQQQQQQQQEEEEEEKEEVNKG